MMNIGNAIRDRHVRTILAELNRIIPDTTFSAGRIRM
jgi:hypothetical protein